jgi:transcriptional regulator with XRE-family HTH domain
MERKKSIGPPRPLLELLELAEQRERWNREVGESLRRARLDAGLSQSELASALDASQAYVSQVEHGKGMSAEQLRLFAETLEQATEGVTEGAVLKRKRKRERESRGSE